jgi:uncharacterized membrane protein YqjE
MAGSVVRETGRDSEKEVNMTEPATRRRANPARASSNGPAAYDPAARDPSLGELVALAVSDLTQLVKCEVDLAKLELKRDGRRLVVGGALLGMAAFVGCLILMLLCFAFAYGLQAAGIWSWLSFLIVAFTCGVLAVLAVLIGRTRFRGLTGLRQTRSTVSDDLTLIHRDGSHAAAESAKAR